MAIQLVDYPLPPGTEARDFDLSTTLRWNLPAFVTAVVLMVISNLALCLNGFILYLGVIERELRSPANLFVLNLAVIDTLICIVQLMIQIPTIPVAGWPIGDTWCQAHGFLIIMSEAQSLAGMVALAWERYCSIVMQKPLTERRVMVIVVGMWIFTPVVASVPWWRPGGRFVMKSSLIYCTGDWSGTEDISITFTFLCTFWVTAALVFQAILYIRINRTVRLSFRALQEFAFGQLLSTKTDVVELTPTARHGGGDPLTPVVGDDDAEIDRERGMVMVTPTKSRTRTILSNINSRGGGTAAAAPEDTHLALERVLTRKSVIIVLVFWMSWMPYITSFSYEMTWKKQSPQWMDCLSAVTVIANSVWNPIMFIFLDNRWKRAALTSVGLSVSPTTTTTGILTTTTTVASDSLRRTLRSGSESSTRPPTRTPTVGKAVPKTAVTP
ncbi:Melanopsin [Gaertneriomyces sp. JEL0708]|nr:Melanopsin [Gaertneriomyces sp. JEL0708]